MSFVNVDENDDGSPIWGDGRCCYSFCLVNARKHLKLAHKALRNSDEETAASHCLRVIELTAAYCAHFDGFVEGFALIGERLKHPAAGPKLY